MNKIERIGFVQAMDGKELWVNTLTDEIVKIYVKDKELRENMYCKYVKVTVEEITEEQYNKGQ